MAHIARVPPTMNAAEFTATDQSVFGRQWRYELVDGVIVGHAAPTPEHGAILANLVSALKARLRTHAEGCRVETGSAATPADAQSTTARIPDALVRCNGLPRITFEIISSSELKKIKDRDRKREDVKNVDGVIQIIEIYQHTIAAHVHEKTSSGVWGLSPLSGKDAELEMRSIDISIPLIELYEDAMPKDDEE